MIKVNFRVTGMYLGSNSIEESKGAVSVEVKENPTVLDVMNAVKEKAKQNKITNVISFDFSPANPVGDETISSIYVKYKNGPRSYLEGGLYFLQDETNSNRVITFQYYIHDKEFRQLNNNNRSKSFGESPDPEATIKDGYTVIIRQICIVNKPITSNYIQRKVEKLSK